MVLVRPTRRPGEAGGDAAGGDRGRHRDADRPAELLGGVDEPGGQAGLVLGDAGQGGDGHRDEGERGTDAGDQERPRQVGPETPVPGTWVAQSTPPPIRAMPAAMTSWPSPG